MFQRTASRLAASVALGILGWMSMPLTPLVNCAAQPHSVSLRADGVVLKNGQPMFPMGLYHVSWEISPAAQIKHLREIATAGFNLVHASAIDLVSYGAFLREANTLGVTVISEYNGDPAAFVQRFKNEPAVLAWNLADDVDNGRWTPAQVLARHHQIQSADPLHPTYISGYSKGLQQFTHCAHILGRQSYPIRQHTTAELSQTFTDITEISSAADQPPRSLFANLQIFSWAQAKPGEIGDAPNSLEVRNMTYQALLGGAKGILYYTYYDEAWYLPKNQLLWEGLKALNREVKSLTPWLLEGRYQPLNFTNKHLKGGVWSLETGRLLVVVNTSQQDKLSAQVISSSDPKQSLKPLFQSLSPQQSFGNPAVTITLPAKTVQVYQIN